MLLGGLFVIALVVFLFLLNGGATELLTVISVSLSRYSSIIEQLLGYFAVASFATFAIKWERISWKTIGITKAKFVSSLPVLFALAAATFFVAWLGNRWPQQMVTIQGGAALSLPIVVFIVLAAAAVEEYVFRGYIQLGTRKHFGVLAGVLVSSIVFAIAHVPVDMATLNLNSSSAILAYLPTVALAMLSRFVFAVMAFAFMYEVTGNIFITIFIHSFYDFSVVYYPPIGGSITVALVCLVLPFVVVFATQALAPSLGRYGTEPIIDKNAKR